MDSELRQYIIARSKDNIKARKAQGLPEGRIMPELRPFADGDIVGSGRHKADARTRIPNSHAQLVGQLIRERGMKLPEASKLASQMRKSLG